MEVLLPSALEPRLTCSASLALLLLTPISGSALEAGTSCNGRPVTTLSLAVPHSPVAPPRCDGEGAPRAAGLPGARLAAEPDGRKAWATGSVAPPDAKSVRGPGGVRRGWAVGEPDRRASTGLAGCDAAAGLGGERPVRSVVGTGGRQADA